MNPENQNLKASGACLGLIKCFETCALTAYLDPFKIPTIAWGHTAGVRMGDTCTQTQADAWLKENITEAENVVKAAVNVPLNQGQFDALVSFVYNVGHGKAGVKSGLVVLKNGGTSTLLRLINAGDFDGAAAEFGKWTNNGMRGLVRRRAAETALFTGVSNVSDASV